MSAEIRFYIGDYASLGPFRLDRAVTMGRGQECCIPLPDDGLSRMHCRVEPRIGCVLVRDLGSQNGLYHNGQQVQQAVIVFGDEFWIGHTRVLIARASANAQPIPPKEAPASLVNATPPLGHPSLSSRHRPSPLAALPDPVAGEQTMIMISPPAGALALADNRTPPPTPGPAYSSAVVGTTPPPNVAAAARAPAGSIASSSLAPPKPTGSIAPSGPTGARTGTEVDRRVPDDLSCAPLPTIGPPPPRKRPSSGRRKVAATTPQLTPPTELFGDLPTGMIPLGAPPPLSVGSPPPLPPGADLSSVPPLARIGDQKPSGGSARALTPKPATPSIPSAPPIPSIPIRLFVDGMARPVTGLDLHVAHGEEGKAYLRIVARYNDKILGPQEQQIWLAGY